MTNRQLPPRPNLENLKKQAKALLKSVRAGDAEALRRIAPYFSDAGTFGLKQIQLVLSREYGFDSWNKLKTHVASHADDHGDRRKDDRLLYCSFCEKSMHEVKKLIAGPQVFICNTCVESCNVMLEGDDASHDGLRRSVAYGGDEVCSFCAKPESTDGPLPTLEVFESLDVRICIECVGLCNDILGE